MIIFRYNLQCTSSGWHVSQRRASKIRNFLKDDSNKTPTRLCLWCWAEHQERGPLDSSLQLHSFSRSPSTPSSIQSLNTRVYHSFRTGCKSLSTWLMSRYSVRPTARSLTALRCQRQFIASRTSHDLTSQMSWPVIDTDRSDMIVRVTVPVWG